MSVSRVLIVGGGITGSVAAIALAQRGIETELAEIHDVWTGGAGHGITLQGNALRSFRLVGVWDEVRAAGYAFDSVRLSRADGSPIVEVPTPRTGGPDMPATMGALRSDLQRILAAAVYAAGVKVRLGTTITDWSNEPSGVDVTFSDGSSGRYDLVIGADGIRSATRARLGITTGPAPTGMAIWRILAGRSPDMTCSELFYEGPRYKAGYSPISDDQVYAYLLVADTPSAGPGDRKPGAVLRELAAGYEGRWGPIRESITDDTPVNFSRIESLLVADPWYRNRVIVIGDAVHACPPLIAQGAAMCTEDAIVLASLLADSADIDGALTTFMRRRIPRVTMVVNNSLKLADWEIHPETPGADPAAIMESTLAALLDPA
jgi:2-polyprenyl-6-methoxyphenol hydroxylase-like FAD-dependent oxidoreductase